MNKLVVLVGLMAGSFAFAQENSINQNSTQLKTLQLDPKFKLGLELETSPTRDKQSDINGSTTLVRLEPGFDLNKNTSLTLMTDFMIRETNDDFGNKSKQELKEKDALFETTLKYTQKYSLGSTSHRFQTRVSYLADPSFRQAYGNDGNIQLRNYYGMNLGGSFIIDKYVSYIMYRHYLVNEDKGDKTRAGQWRLRFAPAYLVNDQFKVGFTTTFNRYLLEGSHLQEDLYMGLSARYEFENSLAILFIGDVKTHETNQHDHLTDRSVAFDDPTLILNLTYELI